ncbi:MAG TPA: outer membrane lipoprotein-sorting protein [Albitalea sp.]|nr:outer membrane lipoprotein-sorting protein [Albitalea sp.]
MFTRNILIALAFMASLPPADANDSGSGMTAERILEATDRVRGGGLPGLEWQLKITASDSDTGSDVRELHLKASGDNSLAETTFPPRAAGGRLLQLGRNMWYGRPDLSKPVSISSRQKMMGPAANGDIASTNYLQDYDATLLREEDVDGEPAYVLQLVGKTKWVTYDRIEYWVSKKKLVPVKAAFYTVSGKLFKTAQFETANELSVGGRRQPFVSRMVIRDAINTDSVSVLDYTQVRIANFSRYDLSVEALTR